MSEPKLSIYFTLSELIQSGFAARHGIDNIPPAKELEALKYTAMHLDDVRALLGVPVIISSGYRSPAVNTGIGGKPTSQHLKGEAVDFTAPSFGSPRQIAKAIAASLIPFDQLILEYGQWVHISFVKTGGRREILTIDRFGTKSGIGD